jgi:hypothetical protein
VLFTGIVRVDEDHVSELVEMLVIPLVSVLFAGAKVIGRDHDSDEAVGVLVEIPVSLPVSVVFAGTDIGVDQEAEEPVEVLFAAQTW